MKREKKIEWKQKGRKKGEEAKKKRRVKNLFTSLIHSEARKHKTFRKYRH